MALKAILKSLDGLSDEVKKLYIKKGEEFHLDVEGLPEDPKLAEFRDNNRKLNKQLADATEALKKFEGVDLEKWTKLQETEKKLQDKQLLDAGKLDELIASKLNPIKQEFQTQIDTAKKENQQLTAQLETLMIDEQLTKLGATKGLRPTAIDDMLARGRRVFKLKDGKSVAMGADGAQLLDKGGNAVTMQTWLDSLASDAPHLFQASNGGGALGNGDGSTGKTIEAGNNGVLSLSPKSIEAVAKGELTIAR